ncbi:LacI family DNA-binding transcriptional regulator [Acidovorax sp. sic0104]|uniref:LacI family DNA-binding transcriptional regulator n=1 Tax=Acidovorax sp. sic0104 TaxID=2854784 RepID=UPI001C44D454|nr:LacI family DNA-binding transcriptional regulator [Acidovorax sp. sic0104]MBV7543205.1 LacI family DNA-binding transcriptional regulator [Acidovorax sp. sic0104]
MNSPAPSAARARPTIADVAAEAGVSKATVSRYFNHRERLLSPDIAARVEAAIAKLAYVPSPMAQALSHGRSRLIGLVVADITNPYSVAVLRGAEKACQEAGYLVMLFNLGNDRERERAAIDALASYQVDGFILNTLGQGEGLADVNTLHGKPAVLVDRRHAGLDADFVALDNEAAMRETCAHLVEQGWKSLLYVTQPLHGVSSRLERTGAFRACMAAQGPKVRGRVLEIDAQQGEDALARALVDFRERAGAKGRCAVVAGNSVVTLRVAAAVARLQWTFGQELGFVGFDDPEWAPLIRPGLSTVAQPTDAIGQRAAHCLLERIGGLQGAARENLLPGTLIVRGSSVGA